MKVTMILIVTGTHGTITKRSLLGLQNLEIRGHIHPIYSIVEIGQNTKKTMGDL